MIGSRTRKSQTDPKLDQEESLVRVPDTEVPQEIPANDVTIAIPAPALPPRPRRAKRARFGGMAGISALLVIGIPAVLGIIYYGYIASNQYVTSFEFAVRGQESAEAAAHRSFLGVGSSGMTPDAFIVSDYLNSPQAAQDVKRYGDPRTIFSSPEADFLTRLDPEGSQDELDRYWQRMVSAQFDIVTGNVTVTVRAFTPNDSLRLADGVIAAAGTMFMKLNEAAEKDFVKLADENLARTEKRIDDTRDAMRAFRAKHGVMNPDKAVLSNKMVTEEMRKTLANLKTQYGAEFASAPRSPTLGLLKARIAAMEETIGTTNNVQEDSQLKQSVTPADLEQYEIFERQIGGLGEDVGPGDAIANASVSRRGGPKVLLGFICKPQAGPRLALS